MKNPFKYGKTVDGAFFADREKEFKDMASYIRSGQNVFVFSNRRYGKTSLVKKVVEYLTRKREIIAIYVDLEQVTSSAQFIQIYGEAIGKGLFSWKEKLEKIAAFFSRIVPVFEITKEGGVRITFDFSKTKDKVEYALNEVYELPQQIAVKYKKRVAVVFDEFQEIEKLGGIEFEKKLRSFIQHHSEVCYIFMGSKTRVLIQMFNDPRRAFYKSAATYPLGPVPEREMISFIIERFSSTGKKISKEIAKEIIDQSRNIPYYVQMYSWHIWNLAVSEVKQSDGAKALQELLNSQNELFFNWYDSMSMHQRALLRALSQTDEIFSQDALIKHDLGTASSVQASVRKLLLKGLIVKEEKKYRITDPFFEIWLRQDEQ
ncbi:MAG: ATP-binding protein [Candidatus Margulisbacteria bacterium]|nr:ATP-binding protein [Candidatus Margulisiibacteriota bacterium]